MTNLSFEELWSKTRSGARAGRGFRYQDAVGAWLVAEAWTGKVNWNYIIPEGVDDITLHGRNREIRVQVKSRHKPNSEFEIREVVDFIIKVYENHDVCSRDVVPEIAIVLERPVNGITATGFDVTLLDSGQNIDCLKQELSSRNEIANDTIELILGKTHIVCEEFPIEKAIGLFRDDVNISPATARILIQKIRELVGIASDENYLASFKTPKVVGISDLQETLEHINSIFDNGSHTSIIEGVCEIANFSTQLNDNDFYFGVDVMPGHVGQGLIFERQQEISDVLNALNIGNIALICGPSGAGKSAIAWSSAYETRHFVRWYRVKGLSQATAQKLLQASKILDATNERPVGFVIDDVGKSANNFWDDFVTEVHAHSGIYLIGTVREEDTFAIASFSTIPVIRPKFGEALAEQIWSQLQQRGISKFLYWREPFIESEGLLLEYIHMLTQGSRLSDTLREQIRRRISEGREDELEILRVVSFATCHGVSIPSANLKDYFGLTSTRFAAALNRLVSEHALQENVDGTIIGLHEIRSKYLYEHIEKLMFVEITSTIYDVVENAKSENLSEITFSLLHEFPNLKEEVFQALRNRAIAGDPTIISPILEGLGIATCEIIANEFLQITQQLGIEDRRTPFCFMMAIAGSDLSGIPNFEKLNQAVEEFKNLNIRDLRTDFLSDLKIVIEPETINFERYRTLVCNYVPIAGAINSPEFSFAPAQTVKKESIFKILNLLECFRAISIEVSLQAVEFLGGTEYLLDKLWEERPWTTRPKIEDKDGIIVVSADVIFVSDEIQKDIHGEVVELCEQLFSCVPDARLVSSRAVFPDGSVAGFNDFEIASKSIPRENLPPKSLVHWNRNLNWAFQRLISPPNETARISALSSAVVELKSFLYDASNLFCRMDKASIKWNGMLHLRKILNEFIPMPKLSSGKKINRSDEIYTYDEMHGYVSDVQRVVEELITPPDNLRLFSSRVAELSKKSEKMLDEKIWLNTLQPPLKQIGEIKEILLDIRAVLGDAIIDNDRLRKAAVDFTKMSKKHSALPKAAYAARSRMEQAKLQISHYVSSAFEKSGFKTSVYIKELEEDKGIIWPNIEIAVLIKVDELEEWYVNLANIISLSKEAKQDFIIYIAPEINNIIPPLAMKIISTEFPEPDFKKKWGKVICKEFQVSELLIKFDEVISTFTIVSAAITNRDRGLNNKEEEYISNIINKISGHFIWLENELKNNPSESVVLASECIIDARIRLKSEIEEVGNKSFATEIYESFKGVENEFGLKFLTTRLVIMDDAIRTQSLANCRDT